jgi:hypothetical protein
VKRYHPMPAPELTDNEWVIWDTVRDGYILHKNGKVAIWRSRRKARRAAAAFESIHQSREEVT